MKKRRNYVFYLACLLMTGCGTNNKTNEENTAKQPEALKAAVYPDEERLDLCGNVVETGNAADGVLNAYAWILNDTHKLDDFEMVIDTLDIDSLRNAAVLSHTHTSCVGFVTGIKTYVGLNANKLTLLFMPMVLCKQSASSNTFDVTPASNNLLVYESGEFKNATAVQISDTSNYANKIKFQEPVGPRPFNKSDNIEGDTRALMITFQEIMAMVRQNNNSDVVKIWNFAARISVNPGDSLIRQSLLLGPKDLTPELLLKLKGNSTDNSFRLFGPYTGKYADRSNLCPPNCLSVAFAIAQPAQPDCQE